MSRYRHSVISFLACLVAVSASAQVTVTKAASSGITVGTTTITSGTDTRVLFNNAGAVGDDADLIFATDTLFGTKLVGGALSSGAANAVSVGETAGCIDFEGGTVDTREFRFCGDSSNKIYISNDFNDDGVTIPTSLANTEINFWLNHGTGGGNRNMLFATFAGSGGSVANPSVFHIWSARGTSTTPVARSSGDGIGTVAFAGYGTAFQNSANIAAVAAETFSGTAAGTRIEFNTVTATTVTPTTRLILDAGPRVTVGTAQDAAASIDVTPGTGIVSEGATADDDATTISFGDPTDDGGFALKGDHMTFAGVAPVVSSCGTDPSTVTGTDAVGRLTWGSGGADATCTVTFTQAWAVAPKCLAQNDTNILTVRAVASTTVLTLDVAVAATVESDVVVWHCFE